jgi:hypothetical protein
MEFFKVVSRAIKTSVDEGAGDLNSGDHRLGVGVAMAIAMYGCNALKSYLPFGNTCFSSLNCQQCH